MDASYTGNKISQLRKQHDMTQKDLALLLSVTDKAVSKWERGLNFPDLHTIEKLADVLHTSVVELLGLEQYTNEQAVAEIADIANNEKQSLLKVIRNRGWLTIIIGVLLYCSLVYTDKMLYDMGIYGINILGKASWLGLIIGCAGVSVANANRLMGKQSLWYIVCGYIKQTIMYDMLISFFRKVWDTAAKISRKTPINYIIDRYFEDR